MNNEKEITLTYTTVSSDDVLVGGQVMPKTENTKKGKTRIQKQLNIYRVLSIAFALVCCLLLLCICAMINQDSKYQRYPVALVFEKQPDVEQDRLCFDPATGHVYSCFERTDGNLQIRINPEENRVISYYIERDENQ